MFPVAQWNELLRFERLKFVVTSPSLETNRRASTNTEVFSVEIYLVPKGIMLDGRLIRHPLDGDIRQWVRVGCAQAGVIIEGQ